MSREPSVPPRIELELRLEADPARRLERGLDDVRDAVERLAHVPVLVPALERDARIDLLGEPADERLVLLELRPVVVAEDERDRAVVGAALDRVRVDEPLAALGRLRRERVRRQARDEPGGELDRVHELALRVARVDADAGEGDLQLDGREGLVLDLADDRAVDRVGEVGAEALEVEVVGAVADLLVDGEADPRVRARELGPRGEVGDRGHDRGDAGLVVRAEQRRPVRGDDVVPDPLAEERARSPARGRGRARRRRSPRAPAAGRRRRARRGSCRRGRARRRSGRRRRGASRRRSRARSARRRRGRARGARPRAGG